MLDPITYAAVYYSIITILSALGLTLTYQTTKVPNFAQGPYLTLGTYLGIFAQGVLRISPFYFIPVSFLLVGLFSLLFYLLVIRPLMNRGASIVILMIATLNLDIISYSIINIFASWMNYTYFVSISYVNFINSDFDVFGINFSFILGIIAVIVVFISLYLLLFKTKFGIAMRASIENPSLASVVGINTNAVYLFSWFLSGALTGMAGIFFAFFQSVNTYSGDEFLPYMFAATILGGISSLFGTILGGIIVGATSVLVTYGIVSLGFTFFIPFQPIVPLVIMSIVLLIFPQGIGGLLSKFLKH